MPLRRIRYAFNVCYCVLVFIFCLGLAVLSVCCQPISVVFGPFTMQIPKQAYILVAVFCIIDIIMLALAD